jgi:hypothetical protein
MGLDGVELLMAIEDAFQIHIADEEAALASTVGDIQNLVISKLQGQDSKRCLTTVAFYRVRRAIISVLGVERRIVEPQTPLDLLIPEKNRRETWREIQNAMKLGLPELEHSGSILSEFVAGSVAVTVGGGIYARVGAAGLAGLFVVGVVIGGLLLQLAPTLAVAFPHRQATVGDLARDVAAMNHARLIEEIGGWNKNDVLETVCQLITRQTDVPREMISPESLIVDHLGID